MNEQLQLHLHDEFDPADRIVEQHGCTFDDRSEILITTYGDGSMTAARRTHRTGRWGAPTELRPMP